MKYTMTATAAALLVLFLVSCGDGITSSDPSISNDNPGTREVLLSHGGASGAVHINRPDQASARNFRAHLDGESEVHEVITRARGQAQFQLAKDGSSISFKLIVSNIENVTMAHIHLAPAEVNGPVVVWLYPSEPPPQLIEGRFSGVLAEGVITDESLVGPLAEATLDDLLDEIRSGNAYVNVHTEQYGAGEIRGQIF
jgi:hypothetical protein